MHYWIPGAVAAALMLSGCSLWPAAETEKVQSQRIAELKVPEGLKAARRPTQYDLPAKVNGLADPKSLDLRAPMQVLAIATNARVDEEEKEARVWFERTEMTGDLSPYLQNNLHAFLTQNNVKVESKAANRLETGWVQQFTETGMWWWKGNELTQESRFAVTLEPRTHGRSVGVKVDLLETRYTDAGKQLTAIAKRREEVNFLNRYIDHVATVELAAIRQAQQNKPDLLLSQVVNEQQQPALLTTQSIDIAWSQLELLFEKIGLEVSDLNQSEYVYFLKYEKAEQGFWSRLWSDSKTDLPLGTGEYQLKLSKTAQGTLMNMTDKDGQPLDQARMDQLYQVFAQAIRQHQLEL